ncbi:GGDEF domain-containing protein [Peteryoungia desertarenae]|uniref:diguanylate cyclase n=1 Tax=Peteryoungia desertarenae TaxID=1813451 RepID=A0ABX6QN14_9HYPH|nr:GGDEF domain-containing protein [Peteryoungia desertarenae]QLF69691.1 GGDEF domain-containing protein [Peteryoungia desertarenae]
MRVQSRIESELKTLLSTTPVTLRNQARAIANQHMETLQDFYFHLILVDEDLRQFVTESHGETVIKQNFSQWLLAVLQHEQETVGSFIKDQQATGEMFARIGLPAHSLSRSLRRLKLWFFDRLVECRMGEESLHQAVRYVSGLFDLALEVREISYHQGVVANSKIHESYRHHLLGQNLAMERERQRAALMEWSHNLLSARYRGRPISLLPRLAKSEFGLWVQHKANILFDQDPKIDLVKFAMRKIDDEIVPSMERLDPQDNQTAARHAAMLEDEISVIKHTLGALFEMHLQMEAGRDPLTHLHTRRFLPSVLAREIQLHRSSAGEGFCVLLLDIDHFKQINDTHGHQLGDEALRQVASTLVAAVRQTDFVFRYGGEEFLIVVVESAEQGGLRVAEMIRRKIMEIVLAGADGRAFSPTVSIGVAAYGGEVDYEQLLKRADTALYRAKETGRNRVCSG